MESALPRHHQTQITQNYHYYCGIVIEHFILTLKMPHCHRKTVKVARSSQFKKKKLKYLDKT